MVRYIILSLIRLYQKTLSPDHGAMRHLLRRGVCIYRPTCSEYAYQAIECLGVVKGIWLGVKRLARCHPWQKPNYDPVKTN